MIARYVLVDGLGFRIAVSMHVGGVTDFDNMKASLANATSALLELGRLTSVSPGYDTVFSPPGSFPTVADVAALRFRNSVSGEGASILLPAPPDYVFLGDNETVDPSDPSGIIGACMSNCLTPSGGALDVYVGGNRRRLNTKGGE